MKLSIIVSAYNEEGQIKQVLEEIKKIKLPRGIKKEVIVIDDGSNDKTYDIIKKISSIRVLKNKKNMGKGFSLRVGIKESVGNIIVFHDADLEYKPSHMVALLNEILNGEDVVYGSRFMGRINNMSFSHAFGNKVISLMTTILYRQVLSDTETCLKMFRREVMDDIELKSNRFDIEPEITAKILKNGYRIKEIPITYVGRSKLEKKIGWKDGILAVRCLFKYRFAK